MPDYVIERVMKKRGRLHVFDALAPSETAFVVTDMQNAFVKGSVKADAAVAIMPAINRLAAEVRRRGGVVAWVQLQAGTPDGGSVAELYHRYFFTPEGADAHRQGLTPGAWGFELCDELDVRPEDILSVKTRHSAFVQGHCNLHEQLQSRGIHNLLVGGTVTNFCCETSARDAMMLDYRVVMVSDCNAARYAEDHLSGLTTVFQSFGDVRDVEGSIALLDRGKHVGNLP